MELTELKAKWNEMDSRLSNIEIINKKDSPEVGKKPKEKYDNYLEYFLFD